jgi:hypothetical protein
MADEKILGRFEMLWDCSSCGKTKLLGITHRHCPECGAGQDETKRYFPSDEDKVAVKDDYAGADRKCPNCDHPNGAKANNCVNCGAPLEGATSVKARSDQVVQEGQKFAADSATNAEVELSQKKTMEASGAPKPKPVMQTKKRSLLWLWILLVVAALIFLIWFVCIRKRTADFTVTGQHWTKVIAVEKYQQVPHEDWRDRAPNNVVRTDNCHDKQRSSNKIPDGQDCHTRRVDKGDGTFEEKQECTPRYREDPVYDTWCTFYVDEWKQDHEVTATADDGKEPKCPDPGVKPSPILAEGNMRAGECKDNLNVDLEEKGGKKHHCDNVKKDLWTKLTKGTAAKGTVRASGGDIVCSDLAVKK